MQWLLTLVALANAATGGNGGTSPACPMTCKPRQVTLDNGHRGGLTGLTFRPLPSQGCDNTNEAIDPEQDLTDTQGQLVLYQCVGTCPGTGHSCQPTRTRVRSLEVELVLSPRPSIKSDDADKPAAADEVEEGRISQSSGPSYVNRKRRRRKQLPTRKSEQHVMER